MLNIGFDGEWRCSSLSLLLILIIKILFGKKKFR